MSTKDMMNTIGQLASGEPSTRHLGIFLGLTAENIDRVNGSPNVSKIIVSDDPDVYDKIETIDTHRVLLLIQKTPEEAYILARQFFRFPPQLFFTESCRIYDFCKGAMNDIYEVLPKAAGDAITTYGNSTKDNLLALENITKTHERISQSADMLDFEGAFEGKPGIIVAAGPTANDTIEWVKKMWDGAVTICCDSALKPLLDKGMVPDFAASHERIPLVEDYYKCDIPDSVVRISNSVQTPKMWETADVSIAGFSSIPEWIWPTRFSGHLGTSVSNMAYRALKIMGCSQIYYVGQDLCYAPDGYTHLDGMTKCHQKTQDEETLPTCDLEAVNGETVTSVVQWTWHKGHTEMMAAEGTPTYTITTGRSAKISGVEAITSPDDLPSLKKIDKSIIRTALKAERRDHISNEVIDDAIGQIRDYISRLKGCTSFEQADTAESGLPVVADTVSPMMVSRHIRILTAHYAGKTTPEDWRLWSEHTCYVAKRMVELLSSIRRP